MVSAHLSWFLAGSVTSIKFAASFRGFSQKRIVEPACPLFHPLYPLRTEPAWLSGATRFFFFSAFYAISDALRETKASSISLPAGAKTANG